MSNWWENDRKYALMRKLYDAEKVAMPAPGFSALQGFTRGTADALVKLGFAEWTGVPAKTFLKLTRKGRREGSIIFDGN